MGLRLRRVSLRRGPQHSQPERGCNPSNMLASPCLDMIKSIPVTWDETVVLPQSKIGELAAFAPRTGNTWFLILLNGATARKIKVSLNFLPRGDFRTVIVRDNQDDIARQVSLDTPLRSSNSMTVDLHAGGGLVARFRKK